MATWVITNRAAPGITPLILSTTQFGAADTVTLLEADLDGFAGTCYSGHFKLETVTGIGNQRDHTLVTWDVNDGVTTRSSFDGEPKVADEEGGLYFTGWCNDADGNFEDLPLFSGSVTFTWEKPIPTVDFE